MHIGKYFQELLGEMLSLVMALPCCVPCEHCAEELGPDAVSYTPVLNTDWLTAIVWFHLYRLVQANLKVPLPFASRQGRSGVGEYLLSFLDESMLVGRAQNGTFVFIRDP